MNSDFTMNNTQQTIEGGTVFDRAMDQLLYDKIEPNYYDKV